METDEIALVTNIENDEFYHSFLKSDIKATMDVSLSVTDRVKKLGEGIELIGQELHKKVLENHNDLLLQANHAIKLENVLNTMNSHVQNLVGNAEHLKSQIYSPYNALETHTKVLSRLHLASHILRQVSRIQQLSKRLSNTNDPVQKAAILHELEQLALDAELKDIEAVTTELRNIRSQQQKVIKLATGSLHQGVINENMTQTTTALQIFLNLGTIKSTTDDLISQHLNECKESLKSCFAMGIGTSSKQKGGRVTLSSSHGFRNKVWSELEKIFSEDINQICKHVKFLHTALNGLNISEEYFDIAESFWSNFGKTFQVEIKESSSAIQQMLEEDYPKLLKCYYELTKKINYDKFVFDRHMLEHCENSYLSSSLTRLLDATKTNFPTENKVSSHDEIDTLIRVITSELSVALIEENLITKVCKNVSKAVKIFAVKTEHQLETGPEAVQVIGGNANVGQQKNMQLANDLFYLHTQIHRILLNMKESLPEAGTDIIADSLSYLNNVVSSILQPLIDAINSVIETIIETLHLEPDWTKLQVPTNRSVVSCSPYMRELSQFITRVYHTYLAGFENKEVLTKKCCEIAVRSVDLLVRHASLLRPISEGSRLRLQSDFVQLEHSLKVICPNLTDLGHPYRLLKSVATLVTLSSTEIVASQMTGSSVPHSTVLLMLFSFASSELASPHQNTGWSLPKLSAWLDEHPYEEDRLDLIAGALQRYESLVRLKNSANYDPVYPIMSQLLERAFNITK